MGLIDWLRPTKSKAASGAVNVHALGGESFADLKDPRLAEFLRAGWRTSSGLAVTCDLAMRNTTVFRCTSLISSAIGMLPLHLLKGGGDFDSDKAQEHPLYEILYSQPNSYQTAYDFRSHMQLMALLHGNAYAMVIRSTGRVIGLVPLDPSQVTVELTSDFKVRYKFKHPNRGERDLDPADVFHLRGLSMDGLRGVSLVHQAAEAIGLARRIEEAAGRLFANGMLVGGAITHPQTLGPDAYKNLVASLENRYSGTENAHKWMVLEEGMKAEKFANTAQESQQIETRKLQIEEIGRIFGVPRPLLGVDDTSWGTGIEQLGIGFVRYGLNQWFTAWEQAIAKTLLTRDERKKFSAKFNEGALLRGSLKDQADFFAKALGSGGHSPWMHVEEVRALMNLKQRDDLAPAPGAAATPPAEGQTNVAA